MINSKERNWIALIGIYLITLACNVITPLLSDDFAYQKFGLNFDVKFNHYLSWSGRVVADFISSGILQFPDRNLMSFVNAIPVAIIIYIVVSIGRKNNNEISTSALIVCFSSYILFNPAIAQTTFWIVGAANYLWTSMFCIIYIWMLYRVFDRKYDNLPIAIFLSLIAGCTNEGSSASLVALSFILIGYSFFKCPELLSRLITMAISFCVGAAILIFSPGNKARMMAKDFDSWRTMSFLEHIQLHLFERLPQTSIPIVFSFILIFALIIISLALKVNTSKSSYIKYVVIPLILSLFMAIILFLAPFFPPRSLNMTLIVNLIPIGFLITRLNSSIQIAMATISIALLAYYIPGIYADLSIGRIG
ncbi:DUF6056 family protein [Janthinobacterium sp. NKUCC06_STL]|uniref:DUF6056 family protein n=1 Tax=Janthinobacterium sp. NKUCC06_STL TaxID=2842127 RepID=UPI001C5B0788|nr:DUF6056 family protein [Janthinobacterium sp. NKUCC06_STL]MBW3508942.1 hypothetical protein [Janthinobacterium sp. NKUCC06_STL]